MNRSSRRVLPLSSPSSDNLQGSAAADLVASPRYRGGGGDDAGPENAVPGAGVRRNSMRRSPVQPVFPESYEERTASGKLKRSRKDAPAVAKTRAPQASLLRLASINDTIGEDYLLNLRVLVDVCDGDGDGAMTHRELLVLLELIGLDAPDAQAATALYTPEPTSLTTYDDLVSTYHATLVLCAASHALPRDDFVLRCKRLKYGFRKIDGDRNHGMTRAELEIATQKLDVAFHDDDLDRIFAVLDRDQKNSVEWCDFVYSAYHNTLAPVVAATGTFFTIDMFADLPSFIRQVSGLSVPSASSTAPTQATEPSMPPPRFEKKPSSRVASFAARRASFAERSSSVISQLQRESVTKSAVERIGIEYLKRTSMEHLAVSKRMTERSRRFDNEGSAVIFPGSSSPSRRAGTLRTGFSVHVRRRIRVIEWTAVCIGALAGIVCGLISTGFESLLDDSHTTTYYFYLMLINIAVSIIEVHGMYLTAVIAAFQLTVTTNLKLYPQDAEREFLTRAIARAALQVGHRKDKLFGIDPMKDSPRVVLCMSFMVYKTKRYALKLLIKLLIKRVVWRAAAKSVLSLLVLPINGVMNAWTLLNVMLNCRVSIIGPPCVVSLLETFFLQDDLIVPSQRVDYVRILGVSLVCKRCIHPNVEIMIEHMRRQWLKPDLWPVVEGCSCLEASDEPCPRHVLDDLDDLLALLRLYAKQARGPAGPAVAQHRCNMFFFFIVALIIDGSVDWIERSLFVRLCNAANLQNTWSGVLRVKDDFIAGKGIHTDAVMALVQEIPPDLQGNATGDQQRVPWRESAMYSAQRIAQLLVW